MSTSEMEVPAVPAEESPAVASPRTKQALAVAGAAAVLGLLGDALLRATPWGLNLALWTATLAGTAMLLRARSERSDAAWAWAATALGFALLATWRDSPALKALDLAGVAVALGMGMYHAHGFPVRRGTLTTYTLGLLASLGEVITGAGSVLFRDVRWIELRGNGWSRHALAVVRGGLVALPLLLVFGGLLSAADAGFQRVMERLFVIRPDVLASHVALTAVLAWATAGILRPVVLDTPPPLTPPAKEWRLRVGIVEVGTVLAMLNVLFLVFVLVQLSTLFGSEAMLRATGTPTFSEYARRGFFELVAVAALVLPVLLLADWALERRRPRDGTTFRVLAGAQVALVGVIIASALHRMALYVEAYGVTELRLYSTVFILWLTAVFGWFAWTVLRGHRTRFAFGALAAAVEAVALLHIVNPDGTIVRMNAARADASARFDGAYAASLSADAVPALAVALPSLPEASRCPAVAQLTKRWGDAEKRDWRAWSLARHRARAAVATLPAPCAEPVS